LLGDKASPKRPGALKPGEHQFTIAAVQIIRPEKTHSTLLEQKNFPPHQPHRRVSVTTGHVRVIFRDRQPRHIDDLHTDPDFE